MRLQPPWEIKREVLYKTFEETNEAYGKPPWKRTIDEHLEYGVIILDKPAGPTSHDVTATVKRIMNVKKAGHGGTLEPPSETSPRYWCTAHSVK